MLVSWFTFEMKFHFTFSSDIACGPACYIYLNLFVFIYVYIYIYVYSYQFSNITKNVPNFLHKCLSNFITELHNVTNLASADSYCSCCTVLPSYSNVNWSDHVLTVCSQLSVPLCTAIRNYKAAQYVISRQLKTRHQQFISLNCVRFVSVRSVAVSSSVTNFAFRAARGTVSTLYTNCTVSTLYINCTVSSTVHKLYCQQHCT